MRSLGYYDSTLTSRSCNRVEVCHLSPLSPHTLAPETNQTTELQECVLCVTSALLKHLCIEKCRRLTSMTLSAVTGAGSVTRVTSFSNSDRASSESVGTAGTWTEMTRSQTWRQQVIKGVPKRHPCVYVLRVGMIWSPCLTCSSMAGSAMAASTVGTDSVMIKLSATVSMTGSTGAWKA